MKIAISVPDDVFRGVERAAKRLGISRSELFTRAAVEMLAEEHARDVTASYDRAFGPVSSDVKAAPEEESEAERGDVAFRREAARRALRKVDW